MSDTTQSLVIGEVVYHNGNKFFNTAARREPATLGHKITYQISQDLPDMPGGWKRGPWGNTKSWFEREDVQTEAEFLGTDLARVESEANAYERTLTHIPIITLLGDSTEFFVYDGTATYQWDGTTIPFPAVDSTTNIDSTAVYDDPGFTIDDQEDIGQAQDGTLHTATVLWDATATNHDTTSYYIDSTEFTFTVSVTYYDGTSTIVVDTVDWTIPGRYTLTYAVLDNQRIAAYPVSRIVEVYPTVEEPPPPC